jgi:NAD(P) transhydrogenase subunit alpha
MPFFLPLLADAVLAEDPAARFIRLLTVFLLAMWVGFEVIMKVPQRLHTPLTSGSNAISGITAVGAIVVAGALATKGGTFLGFLAVVLAMINVAGGFVVTHRMLEMFQPKKK